MLTDFLDRSHIVHVQKKQAHTTVMVKKGEMGNDSKH